jgi:hypothetical protein
VGEEVTLLFATEQTPTFGFAKNSRMVQPHNRRIGPARGFRPLDIYPAPSDFRSVRVKPAFLAETDKDQLRAAAPAASECHRFGSAAVSLVNAAQLLHTARRL